MKLVRHKRDIQRVNSSSTNLSRRLSHMGVSPESRRGAVLLAVLICLMLISMIVAGLVRTALAERGQAQIALWRSQADWLAESGLERTALKLHLDNSYSGETWELTTEDLRGRFAGRVTIRVSPVKDDEMQDKPTSRLVQVIAEYPADQTGRAKVTREWHIATGRSGEETR